MPYDYLKKALERLPQVGDDTGPDFELEPCSGALWNVLAFLDSRKLGPTGRSLYDALTGYRPLTETQESLLIKVLAHLDCPEALQAIKDELAITIQSLAACDKENSALYLA